LDNVLLHGGYILVFCCWTFWGHLVGRVNRAVTRSHSVCTISRSHPRRACSKDISEFLGSTIRGGSELHRCVTNHQALYTRLVPVKPGQVGPISFGACAVLERGLLSRRWLDRATPLGSFQKSQKYGTRPLEGTLGSRGRALSPSYPCQSREGRGRVIRSATEPSSAIPLPSNGRVGAS
jgi:hypothetical protein